ncbi:hypothetical protein KFL_006140050 [Klebsormidium nitens]|uniref:Uncharacterized protein n=1 Tax=Klebsormidium nitens TaxID=105231 RepID=A0A1Y1IH78_KLENI|nr:hypothetical protein KFL_006140050 [Klebsormidium nitens]|eukprot:GAQ90215.1 hypothetical protein KFL_006140050 [Klebsormidium nitens]
MLACSFLRQGEEELLHSSAAGVDGAFHPLLSAGHGLLLASDVCSRRSRYVRTSLLQRWACQLQTTHRVGRRAGCRPTLPPLVAGGPAIPALNLIPNVAHITWEGSQDYKKANSKNIARLVKGARNHQTNALRSLYTQGRVSRRTLRGQLA